MQIHDIGHPFNIQMLGALLLRSAIAVAAEVHDLIDDALPLFHLFNFGKQRSAQTCLFLQLLLDLFKLWKVVRIKQLKID